MQQDPFKILIDIQRNIHRYSVALPSPTFSENLWVGVSFKIGQDHFVSSLDEISEILTPPLITKLAGSQAWFAGFGNLRGHVLPILDLEMFVRGKDTKNSYKKHILVIKHEHAEIGFKVDEVFGVKRFLPSALKKEPKDIDDNFSQYVSEQFVENQEIYRLLNFKSIFENPNIYYVLSEDALS